jgi:hypothetical protein
MHTVPTMHSVKTQPGVRQGSAVEVIRPGRYRHFKGNEYEVIGVARDSETLQEVVVYRALYGERGLWVRSAAMFNEIIERDGLQVRRFEYVGAQGPL